MKQPKINVQNNNKSTFMIHKTKNLLQTKKQYFKILITKKQTRKKKYFENKYENKKLKHQL